MKIAIIGLGLIGGSLAKAIKTYTSHTCWAMDNDWQVLEEALALGAIDEGITKERLKEADLTIVCLHPKATLAVIEAYQDDFNREGIVIDVCGVKEVIVKTAAPLLREKGVTFIGAHPMAGREFSGFSYALADLYQGASFIMTPLEDVPTQAVELVGNLARDLGFAGVVITTPKEHDAIIAFTSQLAHVVSNGYIKSPTLQKERGFSAGSFLDLTRVAKLNADMWSELFFYNKEALLFELNTILAHLNAYREALITDDVQKLHELLAEGSRLKEESLKGV